MGDEGPYLDEYGDEISKACFDGDCDKCEDEDCDHECHQELDVTEEH